MEEYIKEIEQIAARCTEGQSDGYSQIMRICDAMREQQIIELEDGTTSRKCRISQEEYMNALEIYHNV